MLYQVGKERKSKQERSANDNSAWYFLTKSDCCVGQCYRPYGHYLTKFHDHVMWEWLLPPFGRCRSWRLRRWSTELVSHRANLQTQVCPTQMEKQNCILALPWETNLDWLLVSPWTHTWSIQFLLITKSKTLGKKQSSLIAGNHPPGRVISLHHLCAVRKGLARCTCESRTWESEEHRSGGDPDSLTVTPHTIIPLLKTERENICSVLWEISWG